MAREKEITLKFRATDKNFNNQLEKIQEIFEAHDLMKLEYGTINFNGMEIKLERLMSGGGPM